ncbi:MAG: hypothetical protein GOMPHAMPRED_005798 [Gomphillus americanus]|uniref:PQ-loop repeat-containing protein 2 n=1 Tax=Gomphillus americanus TaxID=1940652 RepID=A0A8H3FRR6_9LECA|nr:MAG: hypothetical protein GOMPHAMPRED_005798 [Gomphillus americanus]
MRPWRDHGHAVILPPHCEPQNELVRYVSGAFDTCVPTNQALLSTLLGCLSILAWLFAQLPQIYKNYQLKSTAGLSIYFLLIWCFGDSSNLTGAILTNQASWQITVAAYYTFVDCMLLFQFVYFTYFYRRNIKSRVPRIDNPPRPGNRVVPESSTRTSARPTNLPQRVLDSSQFPGSISPLGLEKGAPGSSRPKTRQPTVSSSLASPKTVLIISMVLAVLSRAQASPLPSTEVIVLASGSVKQNIGQVVAWTSALMYLGSRLPQLYKNYKRQSTSGLSISLFIAAFFGNLFYSVSLLTNPLAWKSYPPYGAHGWVGPEASDQLIWIKLALPFFLGAAGVLALDAAMALQFWKYGEGDRGAKMIAVPEENGQKHWERVNGWMRGFIPSPILSPQRFLPFASNAEDAENRSLLGTTPPSGRNYGGAESR